MGTVVVLAVLVAALPWLWDADPAATVLRARYPERGTDPATLDALRAELDLPSNPVVGAAEWLGGLVRGDLGTSWVTRAPVAPEVLGGLGISLTLAVAATVVAAVVAALLLLPGLLAGVRGQDPGRGAAVVAAVLAALPEIVLGSVLVLLVAVTWRLLPSSGFSGPQNLVLPALALGAPAGGLLARMLAASVEATLGEGWVRTWRSLGVPPSSLALGIARRAVAVAVPQIALLVVGLLGSAVAVEQLFTIPGIGSVARSAVLAQDLPTVQAAVTVLVLLGLALGGLGVLLHRALLGPALSGRELTGTAADDRRATRTSVVVAALLLVAVAVGLPRDPASGDESRRLAPPSWTLPFGADANGRDLYARFAHGALLTVGSAVAIVAVCLVVGLAIGVGARSPRAGAADVLNALPPVFLGLLVAAVAGPGLVGAAVAVALVGWVPLAVHARTLAAEARASGYVRAAELVNASRWRVARRHVLPAVVGPVTRHALARVPHAALALAALSFLGLGAAPDSPEWGAMLAAAQGYLERAPWTVLAPVAGLVALAVVLASARER
ncbi:ABC transporter permease subunit [Actinomycetospora termitidis]|uniref:ABC transporter permease subunit n=1 Tax=Actinomycetospora termitidis TaxID=3053470 RepID=A0ABT7M740_9PSEU|nr:ABC transporter permease subunit [Actinomycetospora sp. Odt1-22]MDL5156014.1 ABC transporter permease subunit [Actinomycetospora sp. Odt1-22]